MVVPLASCGSRLVDLGGGPGRGEDSDAGRDGSTSGGSTSDASREDTTDGGSFDGRNDAATLEEGCWRRHVSFGTCIDHRDLLGEATAVCSPEGEVRAVDMGTLCDASGWSEAVVTCCPNSNRDGGYFDPDGGYFDPDGGDACRQYVLEYAECTPIDSIGLQGRAQCRSLGDWGGTMRITDVCSRYPVGYARRADLECCPAEWYAGDGGRR